MKIIREHLNEIRKNKETGLSSIGVGYHGIQDKIKKWFNQYDLDDIQYHINDDLEVVLHNPLDFVKIYNIVPDYIKMKFKTPSSDAFFISLSFIKTNPKMLQDCIDEYNKRNILIPTKFKKLIKEFKRNGYICVSSKTQFSHDMILLIDTIKYIAYGLYFKEDELVIRRYIPNFRYPSFPYISPYILRIFKTTQIKDFPVILEYMLKHRSKQR